jgi:hypothetical protein
MKIYYLTGMGGTLESGLGQGLLSRGFEVSGRELSGDFRKLDFQQQVDLVVTDLQSNFWREDAHVIANSFGAYPDQVMLGTDPCCGADRGYSELISELRANLLPYFSPEIMEKLGMV